MKNRKGFTLVELIAVIALLGVILLLVVPNVVNILKDGREDTFINQVQSIIRASESKYGTDLAFNNKQFLYCSSNFESDLECEELDLNLNDLNYVVLLDNAGRIGGLGVQDKNYCYVTSNASVNIDKNDFVKGTLECDEGMCSCGGDDFFYLRISNPRPETLPGPIRP